MAIAIVAICAVAKAVLPCWPIHYGGKTYVLESVFKVDRWFIPAVAPIMIGALMALISVYYIDRLQNFFSKKNTAWLLALLLFCSPLYLPAAAINYAYIIQSAGISILLLWILFHQKSGFVGLLEFKPLTYIGKISYRLYVYHGFFVRTGPGDGLLVRSFRIISY